MTQHPAAPRDLPPTRPVDGPGPADDGARAAGTASAARVLADAVAGLLGRDVPTGGAPGRSAAGVLAGVVAAVAGAARSRGGAGGSAGATASGATASGATASGATASGATASGAAGSPGSGGSDAGPAGDRPRRGTRWAPGGLLTDLLDAAAPSLPIRDRARLQQAYPGLTEQEIAAALTGRAARLTGAVGAAAGGLAAAQWLAPPTLLVVPLELAAQTVLVAAVEVVLVGELHELHRRPAPGDARARAGAYLSSWSTQRAVGAAAAAGLFSRFGAAGAQALRRRVTRRLAGSASSIAPLLIGATLAARGNQRATVALAERVLTDLRSSLPPGPRA